MKTYILHRVSRDKIAVYDDANINGPPIGHLIEFRDRLTGMFGYMIEQDPTAHLYLTKEDAADFLAIAHFHLQLPS
jgi:hypothetical protein